MLVPKPTHRVLQHTPLLAALCLLSTAGCGTGDGQRSVLPAMPASSTPAASEVMDTRTPPASGELVLDELLDSDSTFLAGGVSGLWFTYSDETAEVVPAPHTTIVPSEGAIHVSGSGFAEWGVGLSADLSGSAGQNVDLSAYESLEIAAKGAGSITIEVVTPATSGTNEGGTCMGTGCFGHFSAVLPLGAEYQTYTLKFAELTQPSWAQAVALDLTKVGSINFLARAANAAPASIDLWVDRLALLAPGATPQGSAP